MLFWSEAGWAKRVLPGWGLDGFADRRQSMWEILQTPAARYVMLFAAMAIVIAIGVYLIRKVRPSEEEQFSPSSELITNFRELRSEGKLSEDEYRTIKSKLAGSLDEELRRASAEEKQQESESDEAESSASE
ncbi:MAG: hypothetical protein MPJ50_12440 [Pirellulales bacterium]|nr:hypothetical protein [Pirellulales bacterium]